MHSMIMRKKVHNTKFVRYAISLIRTLTVVASSVVADKFSYSCRMLKNMEQENSNMEFFLVIIFLYSVRIQGKTDQKKLLIWTLLTQWFSEKAFHFLKMLGYVLIQWLSPGSVLRKTCYEVLQSWQENIRAGVSF